MRSIAARASYRRPRKICRTHGVQLPPGDMVVYPGASLHNVTLREQAEFDRIFDESQTEPVSVVKFRFSPAPRPTERLDARRP
jgi:hypothetical protein